MALASVVLLLLGTTGPAAATPPVNRASGAAGRGIATLESAQATSSTRSTVVATKTTVLVGAPGTTVLVTLLASCGTPEPDKEVVLRSSGGGSMITPGSVITNNRGQAWFTVTDATAEAVVFSATDTTDGVVITQHAQVTFVSGPPAQTPETPVTLALPAIAAGLLGGTTIVARRRRSSSHQP